MKNPFRGTWQREIIKPMLSMATNRFIEKMELLLL